MDGEKRQEAIFGSFDGTVSIIGFIFGLMLHHSSPSTIAIGGLGGAIAAGISMGSGEVEKGDGPWRNRVPIGLVMLAATLVGSLVPVWPFFIFAGSTALTLAAAGSLIVATWIGHQKHQGIKGYLTAYGTIIGAALLTLGIIALIPASA